MVAESLAENAQKDGEEAAENVQKDLANLVNF